MRIELFYVVNGIDIWQELYATPQTHKLITNQAISEINRKYGLDEKDIRVSHQYTEKEMMGIK